MKSFLNSNIGRLRLLAILEGFSLIVLVFVSIPLKIIYGITTLSSVLGPVHGIFFLLFVMTTASVGVENKWKFKATTWKILIACIIPFGTFYINYKIIIPLYKKLKE